MLSLSSMVMSRRGFSIARKAICVGISEVAIWFV
jgi:hypothetical protein